MFAKFVRFFASSVMTWVATVLCGYFFLLPRRQVIDFDAFWEAIAGSIYFNPLIVAPLAVVGWRLTYARLEPGINASRYEFAGFMTAATLASALIIAIFSDIILFFVMNQPGTQLLGGFIAVFLWSILGGLPVWAFLAGLCLGPGD